jgi:hypothetical protein
LQLTPHLLVSGDFFLANGHGRYLKTQDLKVGMKDTIEVKGSRIVFNGKSAMIASEVMKGDGILKLRDERGVAAWSGGRR